MTTQNPVLVEVHRGAQVESMHRGSVAAVNADGELLLSLGDPSRAVYPRSALKVFQAVPLVESGAADRFEVTDSELALSCASHSAEDFHIRAVRDWLARLGHSIDDLECGPDMPLQESVAHALIARGEAPTRAHQNCSGKHVGMLTLCQHLGAAARGYSDYDHPTQRAWMQALSELIEIDVFALPWERDGCGLPAVCMPLHNLAHAFARYADPSLLGARGASVTRILEAIRAAPQMLAGTDRCCTDVIRASGGAVIIKAGAEGVYGGVATQLGIGFALKLDDGASRARDVALGALLHKLGALEGIDSAARSQLENHFQPPILNSQGYATGRIAPSAIWNEA